MWPARSPTWPTSCADPAARARARDRSGRWLVVYGSPLTGYPDRVAVVVQPAGLEDVAPIVATAYSLTPRERDVTALCLQGEST